MKILLVSHTCMSRRGGQERAAHLAQYADIDLTVLTPERWNHYGRWVEAEPSICNAYRLVTGQTACALPVRRALRRGMALQWYAHWYRAALAPLLRDHQPDVLDIWEEPWSVVAAQASVLRRRLSPSTRLVIETEQNIAKRLPPPFGLLERYVLRQADYAVARSGGALAVLRSKGYAGPGTVIGNGVDDTLFRPMLPDKRLACNAHRFAIGYAGRIEPEKGLDTLLYALRWLPEDVCLRVIGEGSAQRSLESLSHSLGVEKRVRWQPTAPREELPVWMSSLDIFVLPSKTTPRWKEQFGRVLIEAMACGVPVIGADSGAIPEVIGEAGEIFPEGDAEALSACVKRLREDANRRQFLVGAGLRRVQENYAWRVIARLYRQVYAAVLGRE